MPSHPPRVAPAKPRSVNWPVVGLIVAALALVALPVGGFLLWLFGGPDIDPARSAADRFVQHLERNEDRAAYLSMCSTVQDRITLVQFSDGVERLGRPVSHSLSDAAFADEAGASAGVTARLTDRSGRITPVDLYLVHEDGWRVCSDTFG
jgi:hypothetical protein